MTDVTGGKMDKLALRQRHYRALPELFKIEVEVGTYLSSFGKKLLLEETSMLAFE